MALNVANISGTIGPNASLAGGIGTKHISGRVSISSGGSAYPIYTGEIVVTPSASEQSLETAHKVLLDDVTVLQIPYTEVSNLSGGITVNIA